MRSRNRPTRSLASNASATTEYTLRELGERHRTRFECAARFYRGRVLVALFVP
jgi:hypothetical protein